MVIEVAHFINGQAQADTNASKGPIYNPATGQIIAHCPYADTQVVAAAVASAHEAWPSWAQTPAMQRARIFFHFKQLLDHHMDELAALVTREHGKTTEDACGSIMRGIELIEFLCGAPHLLKGTVSTNVSKGIDCSTIRQPLGVCAGVSPFNFPVMVPIWMFASAIAAGNTFVLKPSEKNPSVVIRLAELMHEAGLPHGVLNIVNGDAATVNALLEHPEVRAMTAVASTPVAESIYHKAIANGKRCHTFGGAKNHSVVMPDVDLQQVANALLGAAYGSAGERCMAISVAVVVGDERADQLVALLAQQASDLKIGPGCEASTDMGPLITAVHRQHVIDMIATGVDEGASLIVDGRKHQYEGEGFFLGASLFDHVQPSMQIYQQEIFGPVLCVVRVPDLDAAIALINSNRFGNGTSIFTASGASARHFSQQVRVGMVGVNIAIPVPVSYHSFGGWNDSFFGDIAMHAEQSLLFYSQQKTITSRWPESQIAQAQFSMPSH